MSIQEYIDLYLKLSELEEEVKSIREQFESKILTIIKSTKDKHAVGITNFSLAQYPGEELKVFGEYWWHIKGEEGDTDEFVFPAKWLDDNFDFMSEYNAIVEKEKLAKEQFKEKQERELYESLKKKYEPELNH